MFTYTISQQAKTTLTHFRPAYFLYPLENRKPTVFYVLRGYKKGTSHLTLIVQSQQQKQFILNFVHISNSFLVFLLLIWNK